MDEPLLMDLMHEYGERWQISRSDAPACWTAVERPSVKALHVTRHLTYRSWRSSSPGPKAAEPGPGLKQRPRPQIPVRASNKMEDPHARDVQILRAIEESGTNDAVPWVSCVAAMRERLSSCREHRRGRQR